jgi:anti-sigma B factor antagonist
MELNTRDVGGVVVVDIIGRLTSEGAGALGNRVARLISEGRTQMVLNLGKLSYMDSSGLGEMVACYSKIAKAGGAIRLAETTVRIKDLLAITRLVTVFDSYDTEDLALASLRSVQEA